MQPLSIGVAVNINAERFLALTAMLAAPLITALGCDDGNDSTSSSGDPTGDSAGTDDTAGDSATEDASDSAASDSAASDTAASDSTASDSAASDSAADTGAMGSQAIDCTCAADCDGTAVGTPWQVCGTDPAAASADGQAACETGLGAMCETFSCSECSCVTAETASVTCE